MQMTPFRIRHDLQIFTGNVPPQTRIIDTAGDLLPVKDEVEVEVGQSVCLGVEPTLALVTRYYFLSEGCCMKV
jgi:hypothetical protein